MAQAMKPIQMLCCSLLIVAAFATICAARPSHGFGDSTQTNNEVDGAGLPSDYGHYVRNNAIDADALQTLRLQLLAQQLGLSGGAVSNDLDALLPPSKRQAQQLRFRQCYFNPISCFRK